MGLKTVTDLIQELDGVTTSVGDWVANGTPSNSIAQSVQSKYRDVCDSYSNGLQWTTALSPQGRRTVDNICEPWLTQNGSGGPVVEPGSYDDGGDFSDIGGVSFIAPREGIRINAQSYSQTGVNGSAIIYGGTDCSGTYRPSWFSRNTWQSISIDYVGVCESRQDPVPDPPSVVRPNPNPRPDPGLTVDEEPYEDDDRRVRVPIPPTTDPIGGPIGLPDFPIPDLFNGSDGGGSYDETEPVSTGDPLEDTSSETDSEPRQVCFPSPPTGHIWVGYLFEILNVSKVKTGHIPQSGDVETVYPRIVGSHYPQFLVGGNLATGTPMPLSSRITLYVVPIAGLRVSCVKWFCVFPGVTVKITPVSQPKEELFPIEEVSV